MNAASESKHLEHSQHPHGRANWPGEQTSRIPFWVYTDPAIHAQELNKIFYGAHWSYVGLLAEIPKLGDFKKTQIGEREVIVVRDHIHPNHKDSDHGIRVV